jgi:hypothetical protein
VYREFYFEHSARNWRMRHFGRLNRSSIANAGRAFPRESPRRYSAPQDEVLRGTRQFLMRLKNQDEGTSAELTTRLGEWYGTLIRLGRRLVPLFISERSGLAVLLLVRDADRLG